MSRVIAASGGRSLRVRARRLPMLLWPALLAALLASCKVGPTQLPQVAGVDRAERVSNQMPETDMLEGAAQAYAAVTAAARQQGDIDRDAAAVSRVRGIMQRLIAATVGIRPDAPGWPWQTEVISSDAQQAWCLPGGRVAVYTGLLDQRLQLSDDELANLLAHEIAHVLRGHPRERASQPMTASLAVQAGAALPAPAGMSISENARLVYGLAVGTPDSRVDESEADRVGVELAARAGYDPRAAQTLWKKLAGQHGAAPIVLEAHPVYPGRADDLPVFAMRVMPLYVQARRPAGSRSSDARPGGPATAQSGG